MVSPLLPGLGLRLARAFIDANVRLSRSLDALLPARLREDGNRYFVRELLPRAYEQGGTVYDLGGGSRPCLDRDEKERLGLHVVGLDISLDELAAAPKGVYDRTIAADLCTFKGAGDADAVVCQATLEHVADASGAMRAIAGIAKPGERVFVFAPSRNALFARLNLALPDRLKRRILFFVFPQKAAGHDGFTAYYDQCTPRRMEALARANGLEVEERRVFWTSSYFTPFTPAYVLWRLWQGGAWLVLRDDAAETFAYVFRRPADASGSMAVGMPRRERHVA